MRGCNRGEGCNNRHSVHKNDVGKVARELASHTSANAITIAPKYVTSMGVAAALAVAPSARAPVRPPTPGASGKPVAKATEDSSGTWDVFATEDQRARSRSASPAERAPPGP